MGLDQTLNLWRETPQISENIVAWKTTPARLPRLAPFPKELHPTIKRNLRKLGINELYTHQFQSWEFSRGGKNVVVSTGTASGKTICYNLPVLDRLLKYPEARALYLFPTKALAQDQLNAINLLTHLDGESKNRSKPGARTSKEKSPLLVATYDGDTQQSHRSVIREKARLIISNPDMLHMGILPHHTRWVPFFQNLLFIVLDEIHVYRGVFGSHVANVIRRLKRIAQFYGATPQFVLTSATISNPVELAERLTENPVELIEEDGSARGEQHFLIYNPPVVNQDLGIRRSILQESVYLVSDLLAHNAQTLVFARTRRATEVTLRTLQEHAILSQDTQSPTNIFGDTQQDNQAAKKKLRAYRSGYLSHKRREIERGLREGSVQAVVATNALELGIDIGGLDAVVLAGYPGTIAGTWQQAGRAGRGTNTSLAVLLTSANPLDQFLARNSEYFFQRSPERALINPNNLLILLDHIRCAAFELPFHNEEAFGDVDPKTVEDFLDFLVESGVLYYSTGQYFWMADQYPAQTVSLRTASANRILLQTSINEKRTTIGEVDQESSLWFVHPGAIYLHEAESYFVEDLDLEGNTATLQRLETDYFTEPRIETEVNLVKILAEENVKGGTKNFGEIKVTSQVTGFHKTSWFTHERLGTESLDLPPSELQTTGYWLTLDEKSVETLRSEGLWSNDPNDYGPNWSRQRAAARARDNYYCQNCGTKENEREHDVHHKIPYRSFESHIKANSLSNLITLCPSCHRKAETAVRIRSGLSGLSFILNNLAPLFLMCDRSDLGSHSDPQSPLAEGNPTVVIYEQIPAGIGFSQRLFEIHEELLERALNMVSSCPCSDGCPSCVGPGGEHGLGAKRETNAILKRLVQS